MRDILKHLPLYKKRGREEVFLGIQKSKNKTWVGWEYITSIKDDEKFGWILTNCGLYDLAVNYWELQQSLGKKVNLDALMKNYDF